MLMLGGAIGTIGISALGLIICGVFSHEFDSARWRSWRARSL
jgi:hypothetical protein